MDTNVVVLVGRLGSDPELKYTSSGTAIAKFRLAVQEMPRDGEDQTTWVGVVAWGKKAETAAQYLAKGHRCAVQGRLHENRWETDDGQRRSVVEVVADQVQFLEPKQQQKQEQEGGGGDDFFGD